MSAYVVIVAQPRADKSEQLARYAETTEPLRVAVGGKVVYRGPVTRTIAGDDFATLGIVLEFPDAEAAESFFSSDAYQALVPVRDESFHRLQIHLLG